MLRDTYLPEKNEEGKKGEKDESSVACSSNLNQSVAHKCSRIQGLPIYWNKPGAEVINRFYHSMAGTIQSDWLKMVMWLGTSNQSALFQRA